MFTIRKLFQIHSETSGIGKQMTIVGKKISEIRIQTTLHDKKKDLNTGLMPFD